MNPFLIPEQRLAELTATRQGRYSLAGFNYQAGYAVARLASMMVRRPIFELVDIPIRIRYDWGEDLDEYCENDQVVFTQCKRIANIGQPALLADVLISFAGKLISVNELHRKNVQFRLVCTDAQFREGGPISDTLKKHKEDIQTAFLAALSCKPSPRSDRAIWQNEADILGHSVLFSILWKSTNAIFIQGDAINGDPAGPLLPSERAGLSLLLMHGRISSGKQTDALDRLRRIIHDNLIEFNPANEGDFKVGSHTPRTRDSADVALALATCREASTIFPFEVVDRTFLSKQKQAKRQPFVARQPDWADVVHGPDKTIKFIERSITKSILNTAIKELIEPIERGTNRSFQMMFLVGAPGSGKTTLTRRIAAILVEEGRIVVADAGLNVRELACPPEEYIRALQEIASIGRPVLLIMDDPIYGNSPWIQLMHKISRPGLGVALLAPSPQLLFDRHSSSILTGKIHRADIGPPTEIERIEMAQLYNCDKQVLQQAEEFLVIAMESAVGIPFDDIIRRLWLTLNDGKPIAADDSHEWSGSNWILLSFMTVAFFHRCYLPCPEILLRSVLDQSGARPASGGVNTALSRLHDQQGWKVFHLIDYNRERYHGGLIATAHQRIAQRAWQSRPIPWCDIGNLIIQASLSAPQCSNLVGQLAGRLIATDDSRDKLFAQQLVNAWKSEANNSSLKTLYVVQLASALQVNGQRKINEGLSDFLRTRAIPVADGWLAALQLCYLSGDSENTQNFPHNLDLTSIIQSADFSIAPAYAIKFATRLQSLYREKFTQRLLSSLSGDVDWELSSALLEWLFQYGPRDIAITRQSEIEDWLNNRPNLIYVRVSYLGLLSKIGLSEPELLRIIPIIKIWLKEYPHDANLRNAYLGFLSKHRLEESERLSALKEIESWLDNHPDDDTLRNGYLGFLARYELDSETLNKVITNTEAWLQRHSHDKNLRNGYLGFLSRQKLDKLQLDKIADETENWLNSHPNDAHVRNGYLGLLSKHTPDAERLKKVIKSMDAWLHNHDHDAHVRNGYLSLLSKQNLTRKQWELMMSQTTAWLARHPDDRHIKSALGAFVRSQPPAEGKASFQKLDDSWPKPKGSSR